MNVKPLWVLIIPQYDKARPVFLVCGLTSVCEESIKTVEKNQISDELLTYPIIFIYKKNNK